MRTILFLALGLGIVEAQAAGGDTPKAKRTAAPAAAKGLTRPGIRIPFSALKPETEFKIDPAPEWLAIADDKLFGGNGSSGSITQIDLKKSKTADPIGGLSKPCAGFVFAFKFFWVPDCGDGTLARIDPKTLKIEQKLSLGAARVHRAIAATADSVWMLTDEKTTLSRVDPDQNQVVADLRLPAGCGDLISAENSLWITCPNENRVFRVNPQTNIVDQRIQVSAQPGPITASGGSIWVLCEKEGKIEHIDPKTNKVVKTIETGVPGAHGDIAAGRGAIWLTQPGFPLTHIDPGTDEIIQQFAGEGGGAVQFANGWVWVSNTREGTLWQLDPKLIAATSAP